MKINRHQIAGRLVDDPEVSYLPSGIAAIKLRVQTDDGWYDTKKQEYQKRNTYHTVKWIHKDADKLNLRKDDWVFVEGQRLTDSWEGRDGGGKKYADYLRAQHIAEIPDPWERKKTDGGQQTGRQGSTDQGRSSRDDRDQGGRDDRRDNRDSGRDQGRDTRRDDRRDTRDDRSRDSDRRDDQRDRPQDDIPF